MKPSLLEGLLGPVLAICSMCYDSQRAERLPDGKPAYQRDGRGIVTCAGCLASIEEEALAWERKL